MTDTTTLLKTTETTTEDNSKKGFNDKISSNPNDSAFMLDELLMLQEFAEFD